jgi:hypothetical protein
MELIKQKEKHLTKSEIQKLFPLVNRQGDWHIQTDSYQLVDKIIELWFEAQGYDFWNNPYPEVVEWELTKEKEIIFRYVPNVA